MRTCQLSWQSLRPIKKIHVFLINYVMLTWLTGGANLVSKDRAKDGLYLAPLDEA